MDKIPLKRAILEIALSTLIITGGASLFLPWQKKQQKDPRFQIVSIVQTGPQKEALKTVYLAELLDLCSDRPTSIFHFDVKKAEEKLLLSPVIKSAHVTLLKPGTVYVDYAIRQPIATLADYVNIAIDEEGYPFPVSSFYPPKNLPEIYLGLSPFGIRPPDQLRPKAEWNAPLKGKYMTLSLKILSTLTAPGFRDFFNVKRIDVSNAFAESYGMREIIVITEDQITLPEREFILPRILRLSTKNYARELGNYLTLRKELLEKEQKNLPVTTEKALKLPPKIIDFRIPKLAFIDEQK